MVTKSIFSKCSPNFCSIFFFFCIQKVLLNSKNDLLKLQFMINFRSTGYRVILLINSLYLKKMNTDIKNKNRTHRCKTNSFLTPLEIQWKYSFTDVTLMMWKNKIFSLNFPIVLNCVNRCLLTCRISWPLF